MRAPCPDCGVPAGRHREGCPQRGPAAVLSGGAVIELGAFDEARAALLPYDPGTRQVLRGMYQGMDIAAAVQMETAHLLQSHRHVRVATVWTRPWWRWWAETPVKRLVPSESRWRPGRSTP